MTGPIVEDSWDREYLNAFQGPKKVGFGMVGPHVVRAGSGRNMVTAETVIRSVAGVHDVKDVRLRFQGHHLHLTAGIGFRLELRSWT